MPRRNSSGYFAEGCVVPFSVVLKRQPGDCYEGRIQDVTIEKVSMVPVQCACDLNLWGFAVVMACAQYRASDGPTAPEAPTRFYLGRFNPFTKTKVLKCNVQMILAAKSSTLELKVGYVEETGAAVGGMAFLNEPGLISTMEIGHKRNCPVRSNGVFPALMKTLERCEEENSTSQFWQRWMKDCLPLLQQRQNWLQPTPNFKTGDIG
ncbi:unnamed protein product [Clavelina lepadiformis]|uniref:DUF5641 domain-containing protein n=1 Tax=Clavelina lepadiformis TaxID=159417 RepID=A0ABP0GEA3_CLALP